MTNDFGPLFKGRAAYHQRSVPKQLLHGGKVGGHILYEWKSSSSLTVPERLDQDAARLPWQAHSAGRRVRLFPWLQLRLCSPNDQHVESVQNSRISFAVDADGE